MSYSKDELKEMLVSEIQNIESVNFLVEIATIILGDGITICKIEKNDGEQFLITGKNSLNERMACPVCSSQAGLIMKFDAEIIRPILNNLRFDRCYEIQELEAICTECRSCGANELWGLGDLANKLSKIKQA